MHAHGTFNWCKATTLDHINQMRINGQSTLQTPNVCKYSLRLWTHANYCCLCYEF